ncbi:MAG: Gfo/Idh/MocA family oxidoreductase [Gemmatimonadaceae bacterium]
MTADIRPDRPIRWGVLSTANIGLTKVIPAIQSSTGSEVVAIGSRQLTDAQNAATKLGIPRAYGSYDELLADPDIDAIYNPLPNHLHVPMSIRAANAGKHVLCEKPIAMSAKEARELLVARDRNGVQIAEAIMVRTHPQWQRVRELVASGRIGELRLITGHFSYYRRDPNDVRSKVEYGGGALLDIGGYLITMSRWLFGAEPFEVVGQIERDPDFGVDRLASGLLRFPNGQAVFSCAGQLSLHQRMQILGTRGRIDVEIPFNPAADRPTTLVVDDGRDLNGGGAETIEIPAADQYRLQAERFVDAIRGVGIVPVTVEDAIANMSVLDALFASATTKKWESPAFM